VSQNAVALAAALEPRLAAMNREHPSGSPARARFDRCVDRILGRQRVYYPDPTGTLFPFLANHEYHPREMFPWLAGLEACTEDIRSELLAVLADDQQGITPYVAYPEGVPLNQWAELNNSRRWGAYFLWNQGSKVDAHQARCPRTMAALAAVPQPELRGRAPTAFFSILDAQTHIPPHTGVTNTRLTVHLPLIVPGQCRFRVGGETREWRPGEAWVFDDTIEHEAWNDAGLPRAILLFDIWNPQLTPLERELVGEMLQVLQDFNEEGAADAVASV
jgi:aspartyl/asparaginyl beta-hydroxylase (cupin superfamily)